MNEKIGKDLAIVFGVLSSRSSAAAISQFADAVYPHKVLVHHDFYQWRYFKIKRDNVVVLETPRRTAWGDWSLVDAALMLLKQAVAMDQCDYFQLVSESCLPVRPVAEFAEYLARTKPDVMIDMQPLSANAPEAMMNYAWRYLPSSAFVRRIARRGATWWIGPDYNWKQAYGENLQILSGVSGTWSDRIKRAVGKKILVSLLSPSAGAFPVGRVNQCWVGSPWFALSGLAARRILTARGKTPELEAHFRRCYLPGESYIQTLVAHCSFDNIQPGNHIVFWKGGNIEPGGLTESDFPRIEQSEKFFARRFKLEADCPVRREILSLSKRKASSLRAEDLVQE